jgi:predicted small lipoprotein YifL
MPRAAVCLLALLLCACGQKGNLYLPDEGIEAVPAATPAPATEAPDRTDEARKRTPTPPKPATTP